MAAIVATTTSPIAAQPQAGASTAAATDSLGIYRGVYSSTIDGSVFTPCDVPGIGGERRRR